MEFEQKRLAHRTRFEFGERGLSYHVKDQRSATDFKLAYGEIPFNKIFFVEQNNWLRNVGILWLVIGAAELIAYVVDGTGGRVPFLWLLLGAGCLSAYQILKTRFTIFETPHGRLFILEDAQHDEIVGALEDRRDAFFRSAYGEVDFENDPDSEYQKFEWLRENDIISEEEFRAKISQLRSAADSLPPGPEGTVH
ncbi:MAG: hypothetical protein ACWA5T_02360 [Parvularcula sp.]